MNNFYRYFLGGGVLQYLNIAITKSPINSKTSNAIINDTPRKRLRAPPIWENKLSPYKIIIMKSHVKRQLKGTYYKQFTCILTLITADCSIFFTFKV